MLDYKNYEYSVWDGDLMGKEICIDTETNMAPFTTRDHKLVTFQAYDGKRALFVLPEDIKWFLDMHKNAVIIMQNAPFDVQVLAHITGWDYWYEKFDKNLIRDTKLLYVLLALATYGEAPQKNSLQTICKNILGRDIEKGVERVTFGQYLDKPFEEISDKHKQYAMDDVIHTWDAYVTLMQRIDSHDTMDTLLSHDIQVKGALVLDQIYKNGIKVDHVEKDKVLKTIYDESSIIAKRLAMWGYVKGKKGNKKVLFDVIKHLGFLKKLPKTKKSKEPDTSKDALEPYMDFQFISDYLRFNELEKAAGFIANIKDQRIHPRYTTILTTGRTSCSGAKHGACNIQQLPRVGGIREIFIPKEGHVFIDLDYSSLELAVLAEVLLHNYGESKMADSINKGKDLHLVTASKIYDKPMPAITKEERQFAKIANFGFPANMAASTFVDYCKGYGVKTTVDEAQVIKEGFNMAFPEINFYFDSPRGHKDGTYKFWNNEKGIWDEKDTYLHTTLTGRKRAKSTYTAFLNAGFQGLAADGAKLAMYAVIKAGYRENLVAFIHDQLLLEVPIDRAEASLAEVSKLMVEGMKEVISSVKIGVDGEIKERYSK